MVKRQELLSVIDQSRCKDLIDFIKQCRVSGESCLSETFGSCSKKQLDHVWSETYSLVTPYLMGEQLLAELEIDIETTDVSQCLVAMVTAMMSQKEVYVPDTMYQSAILLQDVLPSLPVSEDKVKNSISRVFETWWKKELPHRDSLIVTSFLYIIERSLDLQPKPLIVDVKRVWGLHEVVSLVELHNASSEDFCNLLQRCFISPQYVQQDEGIKFLGYILSVDEQFTSTLHEMVKNHLLSVPRSWHEKYGHVYFLAWQRLTLTPGSTLQKLEVSCIQDMMDHAVHASFTLAPALRKFLGYFHKQKKQRGVDEMLYKLYEPILWRALRVPNSQVRNNSAALFFDVFPLKNGDLNMEESDHLLQKQFDLIQELLFDPFPHIRSRSVIGVCRVMKDYWSVIPQDTLKDITIKLVQDLLGDTSSAEVRESVVKGLTLLLDNPLCHLFLKPVLSEIRMSFHDVSERVRVAMLDLLTKVKGLRTIKYWSIVPIEHLLARLVVDEDPVVRRIIKLVFGSFIPVEATGEIQLDRCMALITSNPEAARQVFRYTKHHMSITDRVNYMCLICKAILIAIQRSEQTEQTEGEDEDTDDLLQLDNTPIMLGLCEAMCIIWVVSEQELEQASNAHLKKTLQKKFSYALIDMMKAFKEPKIVCVLVQIAGNLPPSFIPTLSRTWLPKLRNMTNENIEDDYSVILESLCKSHRGAEILELATDWLQPILGEPSSSTPANGDRKKKKKTVGFVEPRCPQPKLAVDILSYIFKHQETQDILLNHHLTEVIATRDILKQCLAVIQSELQGGSDDTAPGDQSGTTAPVSHTLLMDIFTLYCKINVLLHSKHAKDHDCIAGCLELVSWTDKHVLPVYSVKCEVINNTATETHVARTQLAHDVIQSLLNIHNDMLLVGIASGHLCTTLVDFCTACLAVDENLLLLPTVLLCLYQVTEYIKYLTPGEADDNSYHGNTIPNALSRIFVNIARYVKSHSTQCTKVLNKVKGHIIELMKVVFQGMSLDHSLLHDVMATIMAAILAEMAFSSQQFDLEDETSMSTLPPLSVWLLDIVQKRANIAKYFVDELRDCWDSGAVTGVHNTHGAVHLLASMCTGKHKEGLKELWRVMYTEIDRQTREQTDEDKEHHKDILVAIDTKMKQCQTSLGMVPP